jgi:uncharacterized membrane protein YgdD (TMEM256/DUF423 family)
MKNKKLTLLSFSISVAIMMGALGAHALKDKLLAEQLESFKTGIFYHLVISIALWAMAANERIYFSKIAFTLIAVGMALFSGSIYLLATKSLLGLESLAPILGPITPLGGMLMIIGWILLSVQTLKK